jgi:HK97 family phage portal protein
MRLWWGREKKGAQFEDVLRRLIAAQEGALGSIVTPDTAMKAPTVHAIVTAVSRRIASTPVHVYRKAFSNGRETKERVPNHPVERLLSRPNQWQTKTEFWSDAASAFVRWGRFYAFKARGTTGPIRELIPLHPGSVTPTQDMDTYDVTYRVSQANGETREYESRRILHFRGASRKFIEGDSPVEDVQQAIALEVLAEEFGAAFFNNGALPLILFKYLDGVGGFKTEDEERAFISSFQEALGGKRRFRAMLLPKGIDMGDPVKIENDKAQFLETRKYQRTVIAGAFGVPPHLVGDLERATFNNVEQQDSDFTLNVIMPIVQAFESAMERDLLTDEDRNAGIVIRFNLDSTMRADFKSRQEGLKIQREMGVINADEWRERENMNPRSDGDGGVYWNQGPSGQNADGAGEESDETDSDDTA